VFAQTETNVQKTSYKPQFYTTVMYMKKLMLSLPVMISCLLRGQAVDEETL